MGQRQLFIAATCAVLVVCFAAVAWYITPKAPNLADIAITAQLDTAEAADKDGHFDAALAALNDTVHEDLYAKLSAPIKYRVDRAYGFAAFQSGLVSEAQHALIRATSYPGASLNDWYSRFQFSRLAGDFADASVAFKLLRRDAPNLPIPLNDGNMHGLDQGFGTLPDRGVAQFEFENYLDAGGWEPNDAFFSPDVIWYHFAQNLFAAGNKNKAFEVVRHITSPDVLAVVLADRRFDGALGVQDPTLAVTTAAERQLEITKTELAGDTKWIEAHSALASRLEMLGRPDAALSEIEGSLINAAQLGVDDRQHYDFDAQYDHALVVKSFLLFELGRVDEALAIASTMGSGGRQHRPNTDVPLTSAQWLIALGRGADALAVLAPVTEDHLSLEGRGDLAASRACAAAQTGDKEMMETNIRYLREHVLYRPSGLLQALLCAGDMDGAANAVIAGLDEPRQRALWLGEFQFYKQPKNMTPTQRTMAGRLAMLRERPDVMAGIDRVGRINHYNIENLGPLY